MRKKPVAQIDFIKVNHLMSFHVAPFWQQQQPFSNTHSHHNLPHKFNFISADNNCCVCVQHEYEMRCGLRYDMALKRAAQRDVRKASQGKQIIFVYQLPFHILPTHHLDSFSYHINSYFLSLPLISLMIDWFILCCCCCSWYGNQDLLRILFSFACNYEVNFAKNSIFLAYSSI